MGKNIEENKMSYYSLSVQRGAEQLANERYPGDKEAQKRYGDELLELYNKIWNRHFAVIYNTGGFGGTTLAVDKDWGSIVQGIQGILQNMGFSAVIMEHQRSKYGFWGTVKESVELVRGYPHKARELAEKVEFLLHYQPSLQVIITGRSHGTVFGNQVMKLLKDQPRAHAILAGTPFWYRSNFSEKSLVINSNGVQPDNFHSVDVWIILKANLHLPQAEPPPGGAIQILKWYINMPGHEYTWQYPLIRSEIEKFLDQISKAN